MAFNLFGAITSGMNAYNALSNTQTGQSMIGKAKQAISPVTQPIQNAFTPAIQTAKSAVSPITSTFGNTLVKPAIKDVKFQKKTADYYAPFKSEIEKIGITYDDLAELPEEQKSQVISQLKQIGVTIPGLAEAEQAKIQLQDLSKNADSRTGVFENVGGAIQDFVGGAISEVPNVLGNVAEFGSKIGQYNPLSLAGTAIRAGLTDKTYGQLREEQKAQAEQFGEAGVAGKEFVQKYGAYDPKSTSAKVGEFGVDIGASLVGPNKVGILKKGANIIGAGKKLATTAKIGDIALEGGLAGAKFDVGTKGEVTKETVGIGALANVGIAGALKGASKLYEGATKRLPASLTLGGLINPGKLDVVKKSLQVDEGIATPDDVGKWILDRVKPGNKQEIADQLIQHAEKTKGAVDEALGAIPTYFKNNEAKKALMQIRSELEGKVGLESKLSQIDEMLAKPDYTLSELNAVKRQLDDMYNMYTKTGDPTAGLKAEGLRNVRANIRKFIENEAEKYGINIRKLNNETSVARGLADGILRKDSSESVRELLTAFAPSGAGAFVGAGQAIARGEDPLTILRDAVIGGVATKIGTSTTVRTKIASALNKLSPKDLTALENYIKSGGKDAIGKKVAEKVIKEGRALPAKTITKSSDFAKPVEKSIITPQTQERAIIQESKKGLSSNIKRPNGNIINNSSNNSNISVGSKKVRKPLIKPKNESKVIKPTSLQVKPVEKKVLTPKKESATMGDMETKKLIEPKFTREQATKYMEDNIQKIMKDVRLGKITKEEGKIKMKELQNDMKYLRMGITPEKLKAGKEAILKGVTDKLFKK